MQLTLNNKTLTQEAIELLQEHEPPEGYHLCFSGGKDSVCIYYLAKMAKVKFIPAYNQTGIDPPELVYFIRDNFPDVVWIKPEKTMWKLIEKKHCLPIRTARFCCSYLKENMMHFSNYLITGITASESLKRRKRNQIDKNKKITFIHPLLYWKTSDVWNFIKENNLPFCSLYNEGFVRIGCVLCPMTSKQRALIEKDRFPRFYNMYLRACERLINDGYSRFKTPEDYMNYWIGRRKIDQNCSYSMFDQI